MAASMTISSASNISSPTLRPNTSSSTSSPTRTSRFSLATASQVSRVASELLSPGPSPIAPSHAPRTDAAATTTPTDLGIKHPISASTCLHSPMLTLQLRLPVPDLLAM